MASKTYKRLIVACDGTWVNSDNGFVRDSWLLWKTEGKLATSSNVTRLTRALLSKSNDGIQQIVYYQGGLGSQNNWWSYLFGGYLGEGISENIREAYAFLCNNYEDGDEIILVGFSRGAFTARSIGGLISSVGLLTKHGLGAFYPIFKDWENQTTPNHKQYESAAWPIEGRPSIKDGAAYLKELVKNNLTRPNIPIKAIGVFDTVGSLGVPTIKIGGFTMFKDSTHEYAFVNTAVAPNIEHAYQALALDEQRTPFSPTIWESPDPSKSALKVLKQTWFPGVHTSIGGGYKDTSISDITLAWMITQLSAHLSFDPKYVPVQREQNERFYESRQPPVPVRSWAMGLIKRSDGGLLNTLMGRGVRTPGEYHATNPDTGRVTDHKLTKTCEFIHPSVRCRRDQHGTGISKDEKDYVGIGSYQPLALKGWTYAPAGSDEASEVGGKEWKEHAKWYVKRPSGEVTYITEDQIEEGTAEMVLLRGWLGVEAKLGSGNLS